MLAAKMTIMEQLAPFKFKAVIENKSQEALLKDAVRMFEKQNDHKIAQKLAEYIDNRKSYINDHAGKYMMILQNGNLIVAEQADIKALLKNAPGENYGVIMKIGEEVKDSGATGFYASSFSHTYQYKIPITIMVQNRQLTKCNIEAIVDTGCTMTVINSGYLEIIKSTNSTFETYNVELEKLTVIGGQITVQKGIVTIEFCGRIYEDMVVQFADLPCDALIGTDLLNNGKLDIDSGQRLSFTHH